MNIQPTPQPRIFLAQSEKKTPTLGEHLKHVATEAVDGWSTSPRLNTALAFTSVVTGAVIHSGTQVSSLTGTAIYAATAVAAAVSGFIAAPALSSMASRGAQKLAESSKIPPRVAQLGGKIAFAAATLAAGCTMPFVAGWLLAQNASKAAWSAAGAMRIPPSEKPQVELVTIEPGNPQLMEGSKLTEGSKKYHLLHELQPDPQDPSGISQVSLQEALRKLQDQPKGS